MTNPNKKWKARKSCGQPCFYVTIPVVFKEKQKFMFYWNYYVVSHFMLRLLLTIFKFNKIKIT